MNEKELEEFLSEVKLVRNEFIKKASEDWWMKIGVERVVFEDILIMYDQMQERLAGYKAKEEEAVKFAEWVCKKGYDSIQIGTNHPMWTLGVFNYEYTSAELYKEYLTQKQKPLTPCPKK